jgi:predicted ATPase
VFARQPFSFVTISIRYGRRRTALPRHQTLGAMIDWSYETLSDAEKIVWCRLAVFRGAFTIDAAGAIGVDRSTKNLNIVDILESLIEKSLVSVGSRGGEARYRLLESIRLYTLNIEGARIPAIGRVIAPGAKTARSMTSPGGKHHGRAASFRMLSADHPASGTRLLSRAHKGPHEQGLFV